MSTLSDRLPSDRRFEFASTACDSDTFAVVRMSGFEAISKPYRFELVLVSDNAQLDLARVLAAKAELRILAPDGNRQATPYAGVLAEFDQLHQAGGFTFYRAVLVPRLWQLSLYRSSEVYLHEQTIPEIVEAILKGARFSPANDYAFKLSGSYRPRSYVCQYQETPLAFISRWFEREGIYYYFEQVGGVDRLVLLDARIAQPAQAVAVNYRPADELDVGLAPDSVQGFVCRTRPLPRSLVLQDYNHRRAGMPLVTQVEVSASGVGEEMLYGENFRTEEEGQRYANIRAQELRCGERVFSAESTAVGLRSGHFMDLSHHYRDDFNGRYLVTEIRHEGSQAGALLAGLKTPFDEREGHTSYRNSFLALPAGAQFRPARTTPKPRVAGTMNATVDAEGSGEYAELDAYGQYKVQIPFDRTDKGAAKGSAPVRMASPYAGSDHGMHFPLHKGAEVLLSFTAGDPDQPVIVGAVPNSQNPNVVDQRNPQDNLITTKGGNQMLMADTKGKEVIWLHSPFHKSSLGIGSVHPEGGGSIYEATTGGRDSVSFGNSNSMSFGLSNSLSLGTSSSIDASFSNSVSFGSRIGIDVSSGISWSANLGQLPALGSFGGTDGLTSLSISDAKSVSLSRSFGGSSTDTAQIKAGAFEHEATAASLEASLVKLRRMIAGYSALNFTQSTIFSMAVNASADGALLTPALKKAKADQDAEDVRFADAEAKSKADEKEWLKNRLIPSDIKTDAERLAWRQAEEKKIDDKYQNRAAEHVASSNPDRKTLQGWPGIIGKFGLDALSNVTAMALLQRYARTLEAQINDLKLVSEMSLGVEGIRQSVNGDSAPDPASHPDALKVRADFTMSPVTGMRLKVAGKADDWADDTALTKGAIGLVSRQIILQAGTALNALTPLGVFRTAPIPGSGAYAGVAFSSAADSATLRTIAGAKVAAVANALSLSADTIEVGPRPDIAVAQQVQATGRRQAAQVALEAAIAARKAAATLLAGAEANLARGLNSGSGSVAGAKLALKRASDTVDDQALALNTALEKEALAVAATTPTPTVPLTRGLSLTPTEASMVFGAAGWKATRADLTLKFGNANATFAAAGVSINGSLVRMG
jgi:type VI secretion system secreted protein VgrG